MLVKYATNFILYLVMILTFFELPEAQKTFYQVVVLDQVNMRGVKGVCVGFFADGAYIDYAYTDKEGVASINMKPVANWKAVYSSRSENPEPVEHEYSALPSQYAIICIMPADNEEPVNNLPYQFKVLNLNRYN